MQLVYGECTVKSLGIKEIDVYDIEVEDNHNFFANDILVHNSVYVTLDDLVMKFPHGTPEQKIVDGIDKYIKVKLDPMLNATTDAISKKLNFAENTISFKREAIASTGFWVKKKRYAMRVLDNEGVRYSEPDIKIVGIETNRSSTPDLVRNWLTEAITSILETKDNDKLIKFIEEKHIEFMNCKIEDIAFPRSANNILKYSDEETVYTAKTPIAVRASILYNTLLEKHGLTNVYQKISEGDKIKFVYLKEPNTLRENIIAFPDKLPPEFNLERYIDKELQFDKVFLDPLKNIVGAIGWQIEESNDLDDFFG